MAGVKGLKSMGGEMNPIAAGQEKHDDHGGVCHPQIVTLERLVNHTTAIAVRALRYRVALTWL